MSGEMTEKQHKRKENATLCYAVLNFAPVYSRKVKHLGRSMIQTSPFLGFPTSGVRKKGTEHKNPSKSTYTVVIMQLTKSKSAKN